MRGFISGPSILFQWPIGLLLMQISYCFDSCSFVKYFKIRTCDVFSFVLCAQDCFGYLESFVVPYEFWILLPYFCETCLEFWNFQRDCPESVDRFEQLWAILTVLVLLKHRIFSHSFVSSISFIKT